MGYFCAGITGILSRILHNIVNHDLGHRSCVDHFILSMALYESINACSINISPLNPSDHCVVELTLGYDVL